VSIRRIYRLERPCLPAKSERLMAVSTSWVQAHRSNLAVIGRAI
jgi:hypothetical protein